MPVTDSATDEHGNNTMLPVTRDSTKLMVWPTLSSDQTDALSIA